MVKNLKLGEILIEAGYITEAQLSEALAYQKNSATKKMLGDALLELGFITEEDKMQALSRRLNIQIVPAERLKSSIDAIALVPRELAERELFVPLCIEQDALLVATDNPLNYYGLGDLEAETGKKVVALLAAKNDVLEAIDRNYANQSMFNTIHDAQREYSSLDAMDMD